MSFKGLTIQEKRDVAESVVPFDRSFNRRCPGIYASPYPCIGFDESNYRECKFYSTETICQFSKLYRELENDRKNRKYLRYSEKRIMISVLQRFNVLWEPITGEIIIDDSNW